MYATAGIVIFSIIFNFLIAPILTKNEKLNKEINITTIKLRRYLQLLNQKEYIQHKFSKFSSHIKGSVVGQDTMVSVLSELENLAEASGVRIVDIRPQSQSESPNSSLSASGDPALYKEILIDFKTQGTIEGYSKFIYDLESSPLLLKIKRFQLSAKPNVSTLEGSFSVSKLYVRD